MLQARLYPYYDILVYMASEELRFKQFGSDRIVTSKESVERGRQYSPNINYYVRQFLVSE
eukprot:2824874-Amphidinium_carterae.1